VAELEIEEIQPKVSVFMITYNHERFIAQAIESVLMQQTDFSYELVIGEDCSTDRTRQICKEYQEKYPDKIRLLLAEKNLGIRENGLRTLRACRGQYIAFLEGDDYWTTPRKLQMQTDFLDSDPDFALCFTREDMIDESDGKGVRPRPRDIREVTTIEDICQDDYISSPTVIFRNNPAIKDEFTPDCQTFDWILWVFIAQYGKIKFIDEVTAVYRFHKGGIFSKQNYTDQLIMAAWAADAWKKLIGDKCDLEYKKTISRYYLEIIRALLKDDRQDLLGEYLMKLSSVINDCPEAVSLINLSSDLIDQLEQGRRQMAHVYSSKAWKVGWTITAPARKLKETLKTMRRLIGTLRRTMISSARSGRSALRFSGSYLGRKKQLVILDDIYPQHISAFRVAEFTHYLETFDNAAAYSTATAFPAVKECRTLGCVVKDFEANHRHLKKRILKYDASRFLKAELAYFIFLGNAYTFLDTIEKYQIPFVFTLYPGGSFALNQDWSDKMLKRVFMSPFFKKVIVTQKITYDYLTANDFCKKEDVEFIYGGVFPSHKFGAELTRKKHFKHDKETLDICFVALKYMEKGIDKGYDVFVEVAKRLCARHDNIYFHVVGPYSGDDIDVSGIQDRIRFRGLLKSEEFTDFYSGMDIILSANVPFILLPGTFDGFPTGACIEAGLNGVVPFITDPLNQNIKFKDGEDVVIIPHDAAQISTMLEKYYHDAESLYAISGKTRKIFWEVFSMDAQMKPRVDLLKKYIYGEGTH
jgi:glycosyltransferase involved in cell wall biosynthesis